MINIELDNFHFFNFEEVVHMPFIGVYEQPKDFPNSFVARLWDIGGKATRYIVIADTLEELRKKLPLNMTPIAPMIHDDNRIIEIWL